MVVNAHQILVLLGVMLGGGVGVALVAQAIKKVFKLESNAVIHTIVVVLSVVMAAAQYVLSIKGLPPTVLGLSTTAIYGFSQLVYRYSKYASDFTAQVKAYNQAQAPVASTATVTNGQIITDTTTPPVASF